MIIAVDFDGTIVENAYPKIGKEIPFAIDTLLKLQEDRHQLILWTCRVGSELDAAVEFCRKRGLEFYACNKNYPEEKCDRDTPRKLTAELFIDDRNFGGMPDWGVIYAKIKNNDVNTFNVDYKIERETKQKENTFVRILKFFFGR